jgi:ABC-type lipopolysaccharide export system ATPase subunit
VNAAAPAGATLQAIGLQKRFGARKVVRDVHLTVGGGEVVGLLGPNGAGKTTTFYMVVGLVRADAGTILIDGQPVHNQPIHRRPPGPVLPAAGGVDLPQAHGGRERARGARTAARR